jgi:hypothetical protein
MANFVTLLGGTNVQSSAPEVRDIIERGAADAVTFLGIAGAVRYRQGDEVYLEAPLYVTTFAFVMNKDSTTRCRTGRKRRSTTTATPRPPAASVNHGASSKTPASTR